MPFPSNPLTPDLPIRAEDEANKLAIEYCQHGRQLLAAKEYIQAQSAYQLATVCNPKLAIAHSGFAQANYYLHYYSAALVEIDLAILLQSSVINEDHAELIDCYYQRALIAKALQDFEQVLADCQQIFDLDSLNQAARVLNIHALVKTKNYQIALSDLDQHIALFPQDPQGYCYRGICYEQLQEYTLALADFDTALSLKSGEAVFHHARGRTYQQLGNFSAALADYHLVIQSQPLRASVYDDRAEIYRLQGDYLKAIADCTQAISINPRLINTYFRRGIIHTELGDLDRALVDYNFIISIDSRHVKTYVQRSWIYFRKGEYTKSIQDCEFVKSIDDDYFCANYLLGVVNTQFGLKDRAIANFTKSIEVSPNYIAAYYHRGIIHYKLGNFIEAIADFAQARSTQDRGLEKLIDRDETGLYAEGLAVYYTGQTESALTILNLSLLAAKRFNNNGFQEQVLMLIQQISDGRAPY
jgi:tetratricopeptide (TPR) repeat protein